jgi:hypothetical protein
MTRTIRSALLAHPDLSPKLRTRLEWCGTPGDWGIGHCRLPACDRCWRQRVIDWTLGAFDVLEESSVGNFRWVEIALDPLKEIGRLPSELRSVRKRMRNLVGRLRARDRRAAGIRAIGAFDVGWDGNRQMWMPTLRCLVDFSTAPDWLAIEMLSRLFPGYGRIKVGRIAARDSLEMTIEAAMARLLDRRMDGSAPVASLCALYEHALVAGGFRLFRFHLRPAARLLGGTMQREYEFSACWVSTGWTSDFNPFRAWPN